MSESGQSETNGRGRGAKAAGAFLPITEVSGELDVPQHVLRFWESKFSQVNPLKRGGGRRYYRPEDIRLLERIRDLLYVDGFTIKGVQRLIRERGVKAILEGAGDAAATATSAAEPDTKADKPSAGERRAILAAIAELSEIRKLLDAPAE